MTAPQDPAPSTAADSEAEPRSPFATMSAFAAIPRLSGLALSSDGSRLATSVATLNPERTKWVSAIWEIDPSGQRPARRLTRSTPGEASPTFAPDGTLLFTSSRPDPESGKDAGEPKSALWALPAAGGEARVVLSRPGGVSRIAVAVDSGDVAYASTVLPGATSVEEDETARKARKDAGVSAVLHEDYPVRFWDHDLGPARPRIFFAGPVPPDSDPDAAAESDPSTPRTGLLPEGRDLSGDDWDDAAPVPVHLGGDLTISADGTRIALGREVRDGAVSRRVVLDVVDTATGDRRTVADEPAWSFGSPAFSPDGTRVVCRRSTQSSFDSPPDNTLWLVDLITGESRDLTPDLPLWPESPLWTADGTAVLFTADEAGHHPAFRVDLGSSVVTRLTAGGSYTDLAVARDGSAVYALRAAVDVPACPVRLDPSAADQAPATLPAPGAVEVPGRLTEITATAEDGTPLRSWLVLPTGASAAAPAPLLLWIHGGPLMSWNSWSWRWNPWLMAAKGYAVLLPDPALSNGYGPKMVERGWGAWGVAPYTDLMTVTDAACARDDIDDTRTGAMGGSFGGYMANWVATQTDRFRAIVTHASLWHLEQMFGTTDGADYWQREFGEPLARPERYEANSPHRFVDRIRTPMLVVHGDRDYRVPIGEGLRLWYDLRRNGVPAKFLYYPDENHWVLTPGNAAVWYETVFAFLAEHVLGEKWERPALV